MVIIRFFTSENHFCTVSKNKCSYIPPRLVHANSPQPRCAGTSEEPLNPLLGFEVFYRFALPLVAVDAIPARLTAVPCLSLPIICPLRPPLLSGTSAPWCFHNLPTLLSPPQIQLVLNNFPTWRSIHCMIYIPRNSPNLCTYVSYLGDDVISLSARWSAYQYFVLTIRHVPRPAPWGKNEEEGKKIKCGFSNTVLLSRLPYVGLPLW